MRRTWDVTSSLNRPTVVTTLDGGEVFVMESYLYTSILTNSFVGSVPVAIQEASKL